MTPKMAMATSSSARCTWAASPRSARTSMSNVLDMRDGYRVSVELRQAHDRPAAGLDLGVLDATSPAAEPATFHRGRCLVPSATLHDAPVEDDLDTPLLPEHHAQGVVELAPLLRHDEQEALHGAPPSPAPGGVGPTAARARRPPRPAARSRRRIAGRRSGVRSEGRPS